MGWFRALFGGGDKPESTSPSTFRGTCTTFAVRRMAFAMSSAVMARGLVMLPSSRSTYKPACLSRLRCLTVAVNVRVSRGSRRDSDEGQAGCCGPAGQAALMCSEPATSSRCLCQST